MTEEQVAQTPEQNKQQDQQTSAPDLSPVEEQASRSGWMPKDRWIEEGHDEADWKPAKYYIEFGELVGKIRNQSKEITDVQNALKFVNEKNRATFEKGYKQAISDLREQKRTALREGDLVKADELDEKIDEVKQELDGHLRESAQVSSAIQNRKVDTVDPEHLEWVERNPWYNTDKVLAYYADSVAKDFIVQKNGQVTPLEVRNHVEKAVRKEFPEKTGGVRGAPNPDGSGRNSGGTKGSTRLSANLREVKNNMSDQNRSIMKTMLRIPGMTEEKYLKLYGE